MMAGALALVGTYLGVEYNVPGPPLKHVRFVGAAEDPVLKPLAFVVTTPDGLQ